jgi:hypothetical protein
MPLLAAASLHAFIRISQYAAGITNIDSSGALIMPPTIGAAMRCITSLPAAPHDGQQAGEDHRHRHGLGAHAQHRAFADGVEQGDASLRPGGQRRSQACFRYSSMITPNSAATPASAMKPTTPATDRL